MNSFKKFLLYQVIYPVLYGLYQRTRFKGYSAYYLLRCWGYFCRILA